MEQRKDRIRIQVEGQEFNVVGGSFQDMLAAVKLINGRRFVGELRVWQLPGAVAEVERQLQISGYRLEGGTPAVEPPGTAPSTPLRSGGDRIRVLVQGRQLAVVGGNFQAMLAAVKNLPGRRFDADTKIWEIPGEVAVVQGMLQAAGFALEGAGSAPPETAPPMEPPDFSAQSAAAPPPFEPPDIFGDEDVFPYEPPDWWDDGPPPVDDTFNPAGPLPVADTPLAFAEQPSRLPGLDHRLHNPFVNLFQAIRIPKNQGRIAKDIDDAQVFRRCSRTVRWPWPRPERLARTCRGESAQPGLRADNRTGKKIYLGKDGFRGIARNRTILDREVWKCGLDRSADFF